MVVDYYCEIYDNSLVVDKINNIEVLKMTNDFKALLLELEKNNKTLTNELRDLPTQIEHINNPKKLNLEFLKYKLKYKTLFRPLVENVYNQSEDNKKPENVEQAIDNFLISIFHTYIANGKVW